MVRKFSKFPKKPAGWLPPSAPLHMRKQVFLYVFPTMTCQKRLYLSRKIAISMKYLAFCGDIVHPIEINMYAWMLIRCHLSYRPDFTVTLIRTPFLPPRYASFYVPLHFNKLDIRDYLQRAYGVKVLSVRSFVEQQKVTRMRKDGKHGYGRLRRPQAKKKMTVEMTEPFVWPEPPKDMAPYVDLLFLSFPISHEGVE